MTADEMPDQPVPDKVLEELLAAFADDPAVVGTGGEPVNFDFDDPSIDRLLGIDPSSLTGSTEPDDVPPPTGDDDTAPPPVTAPTAVLAATAARPGVVDLTGVDEPGHDTSSRAPTPTGSTKREARAAARADAKAVKAATKEAEKSAKQTRKETEREAKQAAKEARAAAKRGEAPPPVAVPVAPLAGASIDPLTPKPQPTPEPRPAVARERVPVGAGAPTGGRRTIVIADDDQPGDALYLDEDAEQRLREVHAAPTTDTSARSTIVIEGTDQHLDALPTQLAAPHIDPRLRARRQAVHQAANRRRLLWAGIIAGVVVLAVAVAAVLASPLFDVRTIDVQGNEYTDPALVEQVSNELRGEAILLVDTQKIERQLEASPWIESARVSTDFPHHVLVDIRERKPAATYAGSDGMFRVIDREGRVLTVIGGRPIDYPLLTGAGARQRARPVRRRRVRRRRPAGGGPARRDPHHHHLDRRRRHDERAVARARRAGRRGRARPPRHHQRDRGQAGPSGDGRARRPPARTAGRRGHERGRKLSAAAERWRR